MNFMEALKVSLERAKEWTKQTARNESCGVELEGDNICIKNARRLVAKPTSKPNLTIDFVIGERWDTGTDANAATAFVDVEPNKTYRIVVSNCDWTKLDPVICAKQNRTSTSVTVLTTSESTIKNEGGYVLTTESNVHCVTITFLKTSTMTYEDIKDIQVLFTEVEEVENDAINVCGRNRFDTSKQFLRTRLTYENGVYVATDEDTRDFLAFKLLQCNSNGESVAITAHGAHITECKQYCLSFTLQESTSKLQFRNVGSAREFCLEYPTNDLVVGENYTFVFELIDSTIGACKFKNVQIVKGFVTESAYEEYEGVTVYLTANDCGEVELPVFGNETNVYGGYVKLRATLDPIAYADSLRKSKLSGKKIAFFGDSIVYGEGSTDRNLYSFPSQIRNKTGAIVVNSAIGGATFGRYGTSDDYRSVLTQIENTDLSDVEFAIVMAGTNDFANNKSMGEASDSVETTLCGGVNNAIGKILTKNNRIKIVVVSPIWRSRLASGDGKDCDTNANSGGIYLLDYVDAIGECCDKNHVPFFNIFHKCMINQYNKDVYLYDGVHLTDNGYDLLSDMVVAFTESTY